jgi:hypothetical protein
MHFCVFMFACLRPVSCMPIVTGVSGLSILDCPFGFYNVFQCNCYSLSSCSIFAAGQLVINDKSRYNQQTNYFINSVTSTSRGFSLRHPCGHTRHRTKTSKHKNTTQEIKKMSNKKTWLNPGALQSVTLISR